MTTPERCPTCQTAVPAGAARCPGCGRVFGEENRCPHCNAIAPVRQRGSVTVCAACGKPRTGTALLSRGISLIPPAPSSAAMATRARARALRGFGVVALALGVLMATLAAAVFPGTAGIALALAIGLVGVTIGGLSMRAGARNMDRAAAEDLTAREAAILELAKKERGELTATKVANALGIRTEEADRLLTGMVDDGSRVEVDFDDEGVIRYVFRELVPRPAQVRVETAAEDEELALAASEAERQRAERG